MLRVRRIFILSCLLLLLSPLSAQENLSLSTNASSDPILAIDSKGRAVAVWIEADWPISNIGEVFFSVRFDESWSPARETFSQLYDAGCPDLCVDQNGIFHLLYADGKNDSSRDIFHRQMELEDGFWSNIERVLLHVLDGSQPSVAVSKDGTVHALWQQVVATAEQVKIVMNSKPEGQQWGDKWANVSLNTNSKTEFPCMKELDGILHVCWRDNRYGRWDIFYNQRLLGYWGTPERLGGLENKQSSALCLDHFGQVHVVYGTDEGDIFHIRRIGQSWSLPSLVSAAAESDGQLDMQTFPNNTLHAVWTKLASSGISIFYSRSAVAGTWQQPIQIASGKNASSPKITSDPEGQAHIVWMDQGIGGTDDIFHTLLTPAGTVPQAVMNHSSNEGIVPFSIFFDASPSSTAQGEIISYWWDFGDGSGREQGIQVSHTYQTAGDFKAKLYVTNDLLNVGTAAAEIRILSGPFPPVDVTVRKAVNKALFYKEEINSISWSANLKNDAFLPVDRYLIYRRWKSQEEHQFFKIGEVDSETFVFADRLFISPDDIDLYSYAVSAVDTQGREGPKAEALPGTIENLKSPAGRKRSGQE